MIFHQVREVKIGNQLESVKENSADIVPRSRTFNWKNWKEHFKKRIILMYFLEKNLLSVFN